MSQSATRVGFLGLGIMGSRMAANLAAAGHPLAVWTHTPGKAERWAADHGARALPTPAAVAAESHILISMVVDGAMVAELMLGEHGVIAGAQPGLLAIDMSTIAPEDATRIGAALAERQVAMLDAPVTGSSPRAEDGTLTIMAGGRREDFERALPLLRIMGEVVVRVGELGQGQALKLVNNAVAAANAAALAEGLLLASACRIDLAVFEQVLGSGSAASTQLSMKALPMRTHDYSPLFKTEHMLKDVRLCLEQAQAAGVPFPTAAHARDLLTAAVARGRAQEDYASIIEPVEGLAGRQLPGDAGPGDAGPGGAEG